MAEFAEEVGRQAGKPVAYVNQSEADYAKTLEGVGLPAAAAGFLASTSYLAGLGELYSESKDLSTLSGRPTTPISETIAAALKGQSWPTLLGDVKFEQNGQAIQNIYLVQVDKGKIVGVKSGS